MMWTIPPVCRLDPHGTAYDLTGPEDAPCVVLIHGLGLSRQLFDQHLPAFADWQVLRYDLYGHGDSAPTPEAASLTLYARQIIDLMDHLNIAKAHIVGFSIGGMINRRFALDYPDRLLSLCILNAPHNRGEEAQKLVEERAKSVRDHGALATLDDALKRWFTQDYLARGNGPELVRQWREQVDPESYAQAAWVLANGVRELTAPADPVQTPAPVQTPVLVVTCENDTGSTPAMSHDIAAEIAGSETIIIPHLQHLGLMEDPEAFTGPISAFLRKTDQ